MNQITISSILGGQAESFYIGSKGSFNSSIAIDPDQPTSSGNIKSSGSIIPVGYAKFSSTGLTGYPKWLVTNPKNALMYAYDSAGNFISYTSGLTGESVISTISAATGNGMVYYNDYIYIFKNTNVDRYGLLSGTPTLTTDVWTGATLGSQTALANTTYPSLGGVQMPNHPAIVHGDGALYFCDYVGGQGVVHKILTTYNGTNNGSAYNVLDLPFGYKPTCIASYGNDLAIGAIQTSSDTTLIQGTAAVFFWDTTNASFYRMVPLQDPLVSALLNTNGTFYVFSGNTVGGVRVSKYLGGDVLQQSAFLDEGFPPFAGAVDAIGNRVIWGGLTTYPESSASVFALGSKSNLPLGLHNIARSTSTGANGNITCLKVAQQDSGTLPKIVIGSGSATDKQLDRFSATATLTSVWRSSVFNIGKSFTVKKIRLPLGTTLASNMTITPKLYVDDASSSKTLNTINSTNYTGRQVTLFPEKQGTNNFMLELAFTGTSACPVILPITIDFEINEP